MVEGVKPTTRVFCQQEERRAWLGGTGVDASPHRIYCFSILLSPTHDPD